MTSIHYLTGWSVDARQQLLSKRLSSWSGGAVLHLVPTRGRVIELESDHRFWLRKRQDTLIGLIYRIFEENLRFRQFKDFRQIDDDVKSLIIRKAMEQRSGQDGLSYLNLLLKDHDADFPGIFRSISAFFSQLIQNNYQDRFVNDLQGRIIKTEEKGDPYGDELYALESDLAWLFGDYEEIKREIGVYDADDVLSSVRDFLSRGDIPYPVNKTDVIILDGFIHLSKIEENILYNLFSIVKEVWWLLDYDGRTDETLKDFRKSCGKEKNRHSGMEAYRIFSPMASFMERLEEAGFESVTENCRDVFFLNPIAEGLYLDGYPRKTCSNSLRIRSFPGKVDEVRGIAAEIKRIIHDDRLDTTRDLGRIRIIFPDLNEYSSLVFEIFREYGLPFSLTSGLPLLSHPLSDIFLLLFRLPLNNFKRIDIYRLFSSGLIKKKDFSGPYYDDEPILRVMEANLLAGDDIRLIQTLVKGYNEIFFGADTLDIEFIDSIARKCGLNRLCDDVEGYDKGLSIVRDFYQGKSAKSMESGERDALRLEYYRFVIQYKLLDHNLKPFRLLSDQDTPHDIENVFSGILKVLGLPQILFETSNPAAADNPLDNGSMIRRDVKAYSLLTELVSAGASELIIDNELFSVRTGRDLLSGFFRIFRNRLEKSYLLDEQDPDVIRISQWLEIRGRSFDYIFAGGLIDKDFPLREVTNFICPETCKITFRVPDNIDMSRYLFSHLLRDCRKGLYLSYPIYSDKKEARPSNIFTDIYSMKPAESAPGYHEEMTETFFKWDDSPYISSGHEMLDAAVYKGESYNRESEIMFPLKDVIIKDPSLLESITRGLRAMGSRLALNGLFEYDGLAGKAGRFEKYLKSKKDTFSASQLDTLANCPMRYLFERVYGLKTMDIAGPDASPMDMGVHLHGVLGTFFGRLADQGKNVSDIGIINAFSEAKSAAEEYFRSVPFLESIEFFEHQKQEFLAGLDFSLTGESDTVRSREGAFALLLRYEEENFMNRIPEGIEYEFGFSGMPYPHLGRAGLRGIIDRFDRDKNDKRLFHIYDYKTGALPASTLVKKGLSFQLPVYTRALKTLMKAGKITAAFYSLKKDHLLKKGPLGKYISDHVGDAAGMDITGISVLDKYADKLMELLDEGRFHHSADMMKCDYCDFRYACHRDERRINHLVGSGDDHGIYSGERNFITWKDTDIFRDEWKKVREKMKKAFNLKTPLGRKNNYESVLALALQLSEKNFTNAFYSEYIDEITAEIEDFKNRYLASRHD
jgi:ATP-dependent helicase/DNAse subunit B